MKTTKELVKKNEQRLSSIKGLVDSTSVTSLNELKSIGGSANFYQTLIENKIITKNNGVYEWNKNIPVNFTLAKTLTDKTRVKNGTRLPKKVIKSNTIMNTTKFKNNIKKEVVNPTPAQSCVTGYKFSFAWGLISIQKLK